MAHDEPLITLPLDHLEPIDVSEELSPLSHVTLGDEIGRGGVGIVRAATDTALGRTLAAKQLRADWRDHPGMCALFMEEARLTASLEHPHILPVHDLGERPDTGPFFTMKRVDGHTLMQHLRNVAPRLHGDVLDEVVGMLVKVCDALSLAHSRGVVHGDLKAGNIMLGSFGEVYLTDWGTARPVNSQAPRDAEGRPLVVGSPGMLAPEQASCRMITVRTDVFGMGALLYFVLARRAPFRGSTSDERIDASVAGECVPLDEAAPKTPLALRAIATKAMSPSPLDRYPSIEALRDELDRYRRGRLSVPTQELAAGDTLIEEGAESKELYIVLSGCLAVLKAQANGEEELIREVGPGGVVGEAGALTGQVRTASVVALGPTEVQVVSRQRLDDELDRLPDWMGQITKTLAARFHERETRA